LFSNAEPEQDFTLGNTIAAEPIGDDLTRLVLVARQQVLEEAFSPVPFRRFCTRMSSTTPCWSTVRQR
jgi:hypothetical protein